MAKPATTTINTDAFPGSTLAATHARNIKAPYGFSRKKMPDHETAATIDRIAMETFVAMVNGGHTLQRAITAVYMTGVENAIACLDGDDANEQ